MATKTKTPAAAVVLDTKTGYLVKPATKAIEPENPLVMVGNLDEARRLSANLNFQNEKD